MAIDPTYPDADDKLFAAHFNYGVAFVRQEQMDKGIEQFKAALKVFPDDVNAAGELRFAQLYHDASDSYDAGDWAGAITRLDTIYDINPDYKRTRTLLYASYYNDGWRLERAGNLRRPRTGMRRRWASTRRAARRALPWRGSTAGSTRRRPRRSRRRRRASASR